MFIQIEEEYQEKRKSISDAYIVALVMADSNLSIQLMLNGDIDAAYAFSIKKKDEAWAIYYQSNLILYTEYQSKLRKIGL